MGTLTNAVLGISFLVLAIINTFLMYKLWGYPYDHEKLKSSAPRPLMLLHHITGYMFLAIYLFLMWQMVPRMWSYEIELPARTVVHMVMGMSIGVILIIKIVIVRWFKYLESTLVPFLGTTLLICVFLLIGLSVPFAFREMYMNTMTIGGSAFSSENVQRVNVLLPKAGFPEEAVERYSSVPSLKAGREVLLKRCVQCHDLRTILVKPRTPENWVNTVQRMSERSILNPIDEHEQWLVSAYLIAISPELQISKQKQREQRIIEEEAKENADAMLRTISLNVPSSFNREEAEEIFEATCSQCHNTNRIEKSPPESTEEIKELVSRMVENGLEVDKEEIQQVVYYLAKTYTK